jgi:hypothetical protein
MQTQRFYSLIFLWAGGVSPARRAMDSWMPLN